MDVDKIKFTSSASRSMDQLKSFVESKDQNIANAIHVFYLCFKNANSTFLEFIESRGIELTASKIEYVIDRFTIKNPEKFVSETVPYRICESINSLIRKAFKTANKYEHCYVGIEHLMYSFLEQNEDFCEALLQNDIDTEHLKLSLLAFISGEESAFPFDIDFEDDEDEDDEEESFSGSYLEKYCTLFNVTANDPSFPRISGRDKEISLMEEILCRKNKSNCILVGEAGTGKTTIVEGLAQMIETEGYNGPLANKKVFSLDLGSLVAGTKYRGQFEERFSKLLNELKERKDGILFIDEIHTIIGTGSLE